MGRPKEILINAINEHLLERMNSLGYKFLESQLKFKRKKGDFSQEIWFRGSKTNWGEEFINFQYQFVILNSKYKKFKKAVGLKVNSMSGGVYGNLEILKSLDKSKQSGFGYDFVKMNHKEIMDDIYINISTTGEEYFTSSDTNLKVITSGRGEEQIDFQIISGQYDEPIKIHKEFTAKYEQMNENDRSKCQHLIESWNKKIDYIKQMNTDANNK